mmetsp:Transcript_10525/g.28820  ORF Transcript_10525/g.28820 Transcript_10525/m.28820 type:complete len:115 (+) Transcript_10525:291-635(+)
MSMELGRNGPSSSPAAKGQQPKSPNGSIDSPSKDPQRAPPDGPHSSPAAKGQQPRSRKSSSDSPSAKGQQRRSIEGTGDCSSREGNGQGGGAKGGTSLWSGAKLFAYNLVAQAY